MPLTYRAPVKEFDSAREFVRFFLDDGHFRASRSSQVVETGTKGLIFRGQPDIEEPLLPKAFRKGNPLAGYTPQTPGPAPQPEVETTGWQMAAEIRAVHIFLETADRLGIPTPLDYDTARRHMKHILPALRGVRPLGPNQSFPDPSLLSSMALAQHYGVPTRLLDWTESPLIAVYFAAWSFSSAYKGRAESSNRMVVYELDLRATRQKEVSLDLVMSPRYMNPNLRAQKGVFTYAPTANQYFVNEGQWPTVEAQVAASRTTALRKYTLPASGADSVLRELLPLDISRASLFPSLENAAGAYGYARALYAL